MRTRRKNLVKQFVSIIYFILLLTIDLNAYSQKKSDKVSVANLNEELLKLSKDDVLKNGSLGFCLVSVKTGEVIAQYKSNSSMIPASTLKVLTTGTALSLLGKKYHFTTKLEYDGNIDNSGTLHGNLYITGGGDPALASEIFYNGNKLDDLLNRWTNALKSKGIKKIEGKIIGDAGIFDESPISSNWVWGDIGNYYAAGASGLSIYENMFKVFIQPGTSQGDSAKVVKTFPDMKFVELVNKVKTGLPKSGDNVVIYGSPFSNKRILTGTVPAQKDPFIVKASMPDPAYFCAYSFCSKLKDVNVMVSSEPSTTRIMKEMNLPVEENRKTLYSIQSPSLDSIIYFTNMFSINSYAENLLRTAGLKNKGNGTAFSGISTVKEFMRKMGIVTEGLKLQDGSGLSPLNLVTPYQMTMFLKQMTKEPDFNAFYKSLPVAGLTGSIRRNFKNTSAHGNLRAKSGYITGVRSYAGYFEDNKGEKYAFTLIVNNYNCSPYAMKKKLEELMTIMTETEY
ncbi:MAG: D-alanyl-D-alanine carboxypeptidase/D-alanyl-D-alanine-endopeptidase [Bacteroidota bacterium]|nr:D-alanyl-D-alanine carboxypeptidase/D-alanyl-D-alanine-endopeptidase [Bacteroidota bacterium]